MSGYATPLLRDKAILGRERLADPAGRGRGEKRAISQRLLPPTRNFPIDLLGWFGKVLGGIFLGLSVLGVARAEDVKVKAPEFVPIVVDQQQYRAAMNYLGGLKFNDAAPVVKWLNELEDRAKGQWEADHNKPAEAPK